MVNARQHTVRISTWVALVAVCALALPAQALEPSRELLANGLDVTIYSSEMLKSRLELRDGSAVIPLDGFRELSVITDISDPAITNKGDGSFHPFDERAVIEALAGVSHPAVRLAVTVYVLPYPRRSVLVSSTTGREIFLSPHVLDINPAVAAYIITHELGHVFHNVYLPDGTRGWNDYRGLRGIGDDAVYSESAAHAYRPKEIFAEDFRVLFGNENAAWDGQIENPALPSPVMVAGLEPFMRNLGSGIRYAREAIVATSYPNPFNPDTEIRLTVPDDVLASAAPVSVRIYDVRGALVQELYSGVPRSAELVVRWDGTDRSGNTVASAQYFARINAGPHRNTLKLMMLK